MESIDLDFKKRKRALPLAQYILCSCKIIEPSFPLSVKGKAESSFLYCIAICPKFVCFQFSCVEALFLF